MGDDVVEFPRGRAKVFTEDEALAYPLAFCLRAALATAREDVAIERMAEVLARR